jgi:hypothetical protein
MQTVDGLPLAADGAEEDREESVQIYECKGCERLTAVSAIKRAT